MIGHVTYMKGKGDIIAYFVQYIFIQGTEK